MTIPMLQIKLNTQDIPDIMQLRATVVYVLELMGYDGFNIRTDKEHSSLMFLHNHGSWTAFVTNEGMTFQTTTKASEFFDKIIELVRAAKIPYTGIVKKVY